MDPASYLPPSNSHCPKPGCGKPLPVKFKKGGINDRKAYLLCVNPTVHSDKYWWVPPHWVHEERLLPLTQGPEVTAVVSDGPLQSLQTGEFQSFNHFTLTRDEDRVRNRESGARNRNGTSNWVKRLRRKFAGEKS